MQPSIPRRRTPVTLHTAAMLALCCLPAGCVAADPPGGAPITLAKDGTLLRAGRPYRAIGVNYVDVLWRQLWKPAAATQPDPGYRAGFAELARRGIPFARISAAPFYPSEWALYQKDKEAHFRLLDDVVRAAEAHHVGLVVAIGSWWPCGIADLVGEPVGQIGNPDSKTTAFVRQYATEVVTRYRNSPAVWAWEMGNEYNLLADLSGPAGLSPRVVAKGAPATRTDADRIGHDDIVAAAREFARAVRAVDPRRPITTGHSIPRFCAEHLRAGQGWKPDTREQFAANLLAVTPDPMNMASIHLYRSDATAQRFGQKDPTYRELLSLCVKAAGGAGKALFVGEFGAAEKDAATYTTSARAEHEAMIDAIEQSGVPLAAVWVYDFSHQNRDWNITATNQRAWALDLLEAANARLRKK